MPDLAAIRSAVLEFFARNARELPWRKNRDPYAIWVSEIMLQQTRVATVIPYFERWLERFPTVHSLASAELDDVLASWSGLGYYSRARNLHKGAREAVARYGGELPASADELRTLPGIGRYTAGAIASQAFGKSAAVVDGNVARVLARVFELDDDVKSSRGQRALWQLAEELVPEQHPGNFNQGLMELGATVCTPRSPSCEQCPIAAECSARASGRQAELPILPKRKKASEKQELCNHAIWVWWSGKVLLARRKPEGLFGGLWELPQGPDLPDLGAAIGRELQVEDDRPVVVHRQELSHRMLHIKLFRARVLGRARKLPAESPYDVVKWQPLTRASERGISSATQAIIDAARRTERWTDETKQ
ncbi:MAG: A/G-specific adenine glycosylase [Deltaproteobacteria bacterium]|nr:A/G-specific adenine glycosylase [Deltaproteobacteria bacterium]